MVSLSTCGAIEHQYPVCVGWLLYEHVIVCSSSFRILFICQNCSSLVCPLTWLARRLTLRACVVVRANRSRVLGGRDGLRFRHIITLLSDRTASPGDARRGCGPSCCIFVLSGTIAMRRHVPSNSSTSFDQFINGSSSAVDAALRLGWSVGRRTWRCRGRAWSTAARSRRVMAHSDKWWGRRRDEGDGGTHTVGGLSSDVILINKQWSAR